MHPLRRRRLNVILLSLLVLGFACCLIMYALRQNINLFYAPNDIKLQTIAENKLIRLGGLVVDGSVKRDAKSLLVNFQITDNKSVVDVEYEGVLPDLFREGQSIVAQGYVINSNKFKASSVLAKHDENYMPQEVKKILATKSSEEIKG